jgi:hypothetical protein
LGLRRSTLCTAGLLALAAAATTNPVAAISATPGSLSSYKINGAAQVGESSQGSAQQCLDSCFGVANCNAASFCADAGGCEGGKGANTCVFFRVDDPYNPPGDSSGTWISGTIQQQAAPAAAVVQDAPVVVAPQPVYQDPVYYNNGYNGAYYNNGVRPATAAVATAAVVRNNPNPVGGRGAGGGAARSPRHDPVGRKMLGTAAAVAETAVVVRNRNENPNPVVPVPPVVAQPAAVVVVPGHRMMTFAAPAEVVAVA